MESIALTQVLLHLGNLHGVERLLVLVLAFGPFIVMGVVLHVVRKRDLAAVGATEAADATAGTSSAPPAS